MEISAQNGVACCRKALSAFPNQFVPTHVGDTTATGFEEPQRAVAMVLPCRNRHVPVPPRFPGVFQKKTTGQGDRQAGQPCPPRLSSCLPKRLRGVGGTGKGWGHVACAPEHSPRGMMAFAHAELCVSTNQDKVLLSVH